MKFTRLVFAGMIGVSVAGIAVAQIYESVDAEGNKVFTDVPTAGAEVVDLPETNTVEAPADIPEAPAAAEAAPDAPAAPGLSPQPGEETEYGGGGDGDDEDWRARGAEVEHHRNNAGVPGVGAPGVGVEPYEGAVPGGDLNEVNDSVNREVEGAAAREQMHEGAMGHEGGAAGGRR